jgi:hypothetical protein
LHGLLKKNNKNSGKKIKFGPPPLGPLGVIFRFFLFFFENIRRRSVRVLKLHRWFILPKKGDINPNKNSETPPPCGGGCFILFLKFFKSCSLVLKLWI